MKKAYVFPGQGSQFPGMGHTLYKESAKARELFATANDVLGFEISKVMFDGSEEDLKQTNVTQPAVFIHSLVCAMGRENFKPDMVAGHSLGEFSALTAAGALSFEEGLDLVRIRANAMQKACEAEPSTMAAVLGLEDAVVEDICAQVKGVVVAANYNCPGQLVISGAVRAVEEACTRLKEAGAKRALILNVGGAFHSPLMEPARVELQKAIDKANFRQPIAPVYQNVDARPSKDPDEIKQKLVAQLTSPVRWTQSVRRMVEDGAGVFVELGPGNVLQSLVRKIHPEAQVEGFQ